MFRREIVDQLRHALQNDDGVVEAAKGINSLEFMATVCEEIVYLHKLIKEIKETKEDRHV